MAEEGYSYKEVLKRHGPLCVLLGLFFAWLLSFPLLGPSLYAFTESKGMDATGTGTTFALFHGLGVIGYGIWGRRHLISVNQKTPGREEIRLTDNIAREDAVDILVMGLSCLICFGLTVAFVHVSYRVWPYIALALGLTSGAFVITCASRIALATTRNERGRAFALSMAIANICLYIHTAFPIHPVPLFSMLLSSVWLLISLFALYLYSSDFSSMPAGNKSAMTKAECVQGLQSKRLFLSLAVLIAATSIIGGFAYQVIFPSLTLPGNLDRFYDVLPYILMCFLCGWIADSFGRRPLANYGFVFLGLSMPAISLFQGTLGYLVTQTLIQSAYACIDVFLWVSLADIAPQDQVSYYYGLGLGLNVCLIFAGMFLVERFLSIGEAGFTGIAPVATVLLFFAVIGLVRLEETITPEAAVDQGTDTTRTAIQESKSGTGYSDLSHTPPLITGLSSKEPSHQVKEAIDYYVLDLMAAEYALTRRELEVVVLLLKGLTNDEIQERLCISEGTLKTHLRHIFRKLDVSNRKELLVGFTQFLASSKDPNRKADLH